MSTDFPLLFNPAARVAAVVVFATPPLILEIEIITYLLLSVFY
jgi:hypothetical protein